MQIWYASHKVIKETGERGKYEGPKHSLFGMTIEKEENTMAVILQLPV